MYIEQRIAEQVVRAEGWDAYFAKMDVAREAADTEDGLENVSPLFIFALTESFNI